MVEEIDSNKDNRSTIFRWITGSIGFICIIIIIGMKMADPDMSIGIFIWALIVTLVFFFVSLFGRRIYNLTKKLSDHESKSKEPITEKEVEKRICEILLRFKNEPEHDIPIQHETTTVNGSLVYQSKIPLRFDQKFYENKKTIQSKVAIIIINANYPKIKPTLLHGSVEESKIMSAVNKISQNPDQPDIEETEVSRDAFGNPTQKTRRIVHHKPEEKKEGSAV